MKPHDWELVLSILSTLIGGAIALLFVLPGDGQPPVHAQVSIPYTPRVVTEAQAELWMEINSKREPDRPLAWNTNLARAAQWIADDNARTGVLSHVGTDGSTVGVRAKREGYDRFMVVENAAECPRGQLAAEVVTLWMNSPEHRRNMLSPAFRGVGIGIAAKDGQKFVFAVFGDTP